MKIDILAIFFLVLAATFKNDFSLEGGLSADWSSLTVSPYVKALQNQSNNFLVLGLFLVAFSIFTQNNNKKLPPKKVLLLALLLSLTAMRTIFESSLLAAKQVSAAIIVTMLAVMLVSRISRFGIERVADAVHIALVGDATVFILLNLNQYMRGDGYVSGFYRFFGSTSHPNFMGVQSALFGLVLLPYVWRARSLLPGLSGVAAALFLLYLSGSRTGILIFGVGALATLVGKPYGRAAAILILVAAVAANFGVSSLAGSSEALDVYDRGSGGQDTRTGAWLLMLEALVDSPLIGQGVYADASENSILKWGAILGIPGLLIFSVIYFGVLKLALKSVLAPRRDSKSRVGIFSALGMALAAGAIFEGYLADNFSLPLLLFLFCMVFVSHRAPLKKAPI